MNYETSLDQLRLAEAWGARSFVFAGSSAEYGTVDKLPLVEADADDTTAHPSPYGRAKYLASSTIAASPIGCSLRCFNIYGPRQDPLSPYSGVISRFANQALKGQPLNVYGDGWQTRDFIYITDVIRAYLLAGGIGEGGPLTGLYNLGSGTSTSVLELAHILLRLTRSSSQILYGESRRGDIRHSLADASRLRAKGFSPTVPLEEGLLLLLEDYSRMETDARKISIKYCKFK